MDWGEAAPAVWWGLRGHHGCRAGNRHRVLGLQCVVLLLSHWVGGGWWWLGGGGSGGVRSKTELCMVN